MGRATYEVGTGAVRVSAPPAAHPPAPAGRAGGQSRPELFTVAAAYGLLSPTCAGRSPPVVVASQI